jgi:RNA polymerase primary sigma factor
MHSLQITPSITNYDTRSVETYFRDITRFALLPAEEEVLLAQKIRQGDQAALDKLTKTNLRFVVSVAKKYQYQGLPLADLISEGNIGLIIAAKKFDETKGFKFISYAVWWIRQRMLEAIAEHTRIVRLPMNHINTLTRMSRLSAELEGRLERRPTRAELSECTGIAIEVIQAAHFYGSHALSYDAPLGDHDDYSLLDRLKNQAKNKEEELLADASGVAIQRLLRTLSSKEKKVIEMAFGIGYEDAMENREIARKIGMSTENVRIIKRNSLLKLKEIAEPIKNQLF